MSTGSKMSPHFRHEPNNERAHECEFFADSYGYESVYHRAPMPMFIRRSRADKSRYIVEGGFRYLDSLLFSRLQNDGAAVVISQKVYKVTPQRFRGGLTKIPFENISLSCGSIVKLVNTPLSLNATWGCPEDATRAMVFTRDIDSSQGKRLNNGDVLAFEADYFLLAPKSESSEIERAFPGSRRVGYAGSRPNHMSLSVHEVHLSKTNPNWRAGKRFLEECGFEINDFGDAPELLWPPSLMSGGDLQPLFSRSRCAFEARFLSTDEGKLFVHTSADAAGRTQTVSLKHACKSGYGFAILKNPAKVCFVTTRNSAFSSAVLLQPLDASAIKGLHVMRPPCIVESSGDDGVFRLHLNVPGHVFLLKKRKPIFKLNATEESHAFDIDSDKADFVRVYLPLRASLDDYFAFERILMDSNTYEIDAAKSDCRRELIEALLPSDVQRGVKRVGGNMARTHDGLGKQIAMARRRSR